MRGLSPIGTCSQFRGESIYKARGVTRRPERLQYDADLQKVREFLRDWDAIGVYHLADPEDDDWPPDEYDSYIPHILSLLHSGHGADRIASHLEFARTQQMGLPPHSSRDLEFARRIEDWWRSKPQ
jgi:hypothetical protein